MSNNNNNRDPEFYQNFCRQMVTGSRGEMRGDTEQHHSSRGRSNNRGGMNGRRPDVSRSPDVQGQSNSHSWGNHGYQDFQGREGGNRGGAASRQNFNNSYTNRGAHRSSNYTNNRFDNNHQNWGERSHQRGNFSSSSHRSTNYIANSFNNNARDWRERNNQDTRSHDYHPHPYRGRRTSSSSSRPDNRDSEPRRSDTRQKSDEAETHDYMDDLIQYVRDRHRVDDEYQRRSQSRPPSYERDRRSSSRSSLWDRKPKDMKENSKSEILSNAQSDSKSETLVANEFPSSHTQQTDLDHSESASITAESFCQPAQTHQNTADHSSITQTNDFSSTDAGINITPSTASVISEPNKVLPSSAEIESIDLSGILNSTENELSNVALPSSTIELIDLSDSSDDVDDSAYSSFKKEDEHATSVTSISPKHINSNADLSTTTKNLDVSAKLPESETRLNRKRSIDAISGATKSSACNRSETTNNIQQADSKEMPAKKLMCHIPVRALKTQETKLSDKSVAIAQSAEENNNKVAPSIPSTSGNPKSSRDQHSSATMRNTHQPNAKEVPVKKRATATELPTQENKRSKLSTTVITLQVEKPRNNLIGVSTSDLNDVIVASPPGSNNAIVASPSGSKNVIAASSSGLNDQQNRVNVDVYSFDPDVDAINIPKYVPKAPVNQVQNDSVSEKKESKIDLHRNVDKKLKKSVKGENATDSTNNRSNIFTKNRVEQFKFILKIIKTRSQSWTLAELSDLNEKNFLNAIHHFEKRSDEICVLTEIKFFDASSKACKINYKNLFGDEFNIQRYFNIFYKYRETCFRNRQSKLVIMTNLMLDEKLFCENGIRVFCVNDLYTLKIRAPYEESKIYERFLECLVLPKLAKLLSDHIRNDSKAAHFKLDLFRKYHLALVKEKVLRMCDDKRHGKTIRVAKFHPDFIRNYELSNAAKELRDHLERRQRCLLTDTVNFRVANKDFGEDVASTRFDETVDVLPTENCRETFEHFFQIFEIVKITKLSDQVVARELGEQFLKLEDEAYLKAVQEELLLSLKSDGLTTGVLETLKQTISKVEVKDKIRQRPTLQLDIEFAQGTFASLRESTGQDVILCSTESLVLSELKMRQFSRDLGYTENQESLFVTDEILLGMTDDVVNAFSQRSTRLLVILWENNLVVTDSRRTRQIEEAIERLREVSASESKKSVIIADRGNVNLSLPRYRVSRIDEDLTIEAQNDRLKSKNVFLQGRTRQLGDLADDAAINSLIIGSPKILEKFLIEEVKVGRKLAKPAGFREKSYEIKLQQRVIVDSDIFRQTIDDVFLISDVSREIFFRDCKPSGRVVYLSDSPSKQTNLSRVKCALLGSNVNPVNVMEKISGKTVHLLGYESGAFVWKYSRGSSAALLDYKLKNDNEPCTPSTIEDILINGPKTVVVSGESGSGKSVCLYEIANLAACRSADPLWTIQVDLSRPIKHNLKGYPIETSENAIHFLADYLDLTDEQKELFIASAQGRMKMKLMLFVDGFDDANANDVAMMTSLLRYLQASQIERMFVAGRTNKLEKALGTFSHSLRFGNEEKTLLCAAGKGVNFDPRAKANLLNTPLHLKMFVEVCRKKPEKSSSIANHYDLYRSYVNLHLSSRKLEDAYKLAAQKLLRENELKEIGARIDSVDLQLPAELTRSTVTEYFAAKWLSKRRHPSNKQCVDQLIERTSPIFIITYLAAYKAENKCNVDANEYAICGLLRSLKAILQLEDGAANKPCLSRLIREGKSKTLEVARFLLDRYNDTGCRRDLVRYDEYPDSELAKYVNERVDGRTPVQTAAKCRRVDLACELMLAGADISPLRSSFVKSMATHASEQLANGDVRLGAVAAVLLEKSPQATAHLDDEAQLPRVLAYLFSRGHVNLIDQLLNVRRTNDRSALLETRVGGKTLLDLVNESRCIADEDRLSLIRYLHKNDNRGNLVKNNLESILRAACLNGHEQTFNYFVQSPWTSVDLLRAALRANDERIIDFLMRDSKRTIDAHGNTALHQAVSMQPSVSRKTISYLLGRVGVNDTNKSGETALHLAFKAGADLSTIKFLVEVGGASLTAADNDGFQPWYFAIKEESSRYAVEQQPELMRYLIVEKNVSLPAEEQSKNLAFDQTMRELRPKLDYFRNIDAYNVDYVDEEGCSRLHAALANNNDKSWCSFLVSHGADVNVEGGNGKLAFHAALDAGCYDVAKLMMQHGAMIDAKDKKGETPLESLSYRPDDDPQCRTMKDILALAGNIFYDARALEAIETVNASNIDSSHFRYLLNCRDRHNRTLLHVAAAKGNDLIDHLDRLAKECQRRYRDFPAMDVNAVDAHGDTPLHLAARENNVSAACKLLSMGARFQKLNFPGEKAIDLATQGSDVRKLLHAAEKLFALLDDRSSSSEAFKLLKRYPQLANARNRLGKSALHATRDETLIKRIAAQKYLDLEAIDGDGRTPMYYAAREDQLDKAILLLKIGLSYDFRGFEEGGDNNRTCRLLRRIHGLFEDVHSHEPKFCVGGSPWLLDDELDDIGVARDVIVNARDAERNTLLHHAAKYDYVDVVENLLRNGAICDSRNKRGQTPRDLATANAKRLLEAVGEMFANLDVDSAAAMDTTVATNCRTRGGYTLLHRAAEARNRRLVRWLVEHGADVEATANNSVGLRREDYPDLPELAVGKR